MNNFKTYNISNLSFSDIKNLELEYLKQVRNAYIKKVEININDNNLNINIEPYYYNSSPTKWDELQKTLLNKNIRFWFRDDDIGLANNKLIELMDYFNKKNINILLAAIPTEVNYGTKDVLMKFDNYIIAQHGYSHKNYSNVENAEFTLERNIDVVKDEIEKGSKKLKKIFKNKYLKIFVPPWFEIDDNTHKTIKKLGFIALSNYWENKKNKFGMNEINCQVDLVDWQKAWTFGGEDYVLDQIINSISKCGTNGDIGILLHHERCGKETYEFLDKFLNYIKDKATIIDFSKEMKELCIKHD